MIQLYDEIKDTFFSTWESEGDVYNLHCIYPLEAQQKPLMVVGRNNWDPTVNLKLSVWLISATHTTLHKAGAPLSPAILNCNYGREVCDIAKAGGGGGVGRLLHCCRQPSCPTEAWANHFYLFFASQPAE